MDDSFTIDVDYQGKVLEFEAVLHITGYTHKIEVLVEGVPVLFEPDEERNYRAMVSSDHADKSGKLKPEIVRAIAQRLQALRNNG